MIDKKASAERVSGMLEASAWEFTVDDDDPNLITLDFETSVREDLRISVIAGDDWVYVSHIFGRNPADNQAAVHRRLLEINWILNGCKFAVDEEGDIILLTELLASDVDQAELEEAINAIATASEEYYQEVRELGLRT
jgi:Putative bacterial sensory transduction regulator